MISIPFKLRNIFHQFFIIGLTILSLQGFSQEEDMKRALENFPSLLYERPDSIIQVAEKVLFSDFVSDSLRASAAYWLGNGYYIQGDYYAGAGYYKQALSMDYVKKSMKMRGAILNNLGNIYDNTGRYQEALKVYLESLEIDRELGDLRGVALSQNNVGLVYLNLEQYPESKRFLEEALVYFEEVQDVGGLALVNQNLGKLMGHQRKFIESVIFLERGLEYHVKSENYYEQAGTLILLSEMLMYIDDLEGAYETIAKAEKIVNEHGYQSVDVWIDLAKADFYVRIGELDKAHEIVKNMNVGTLYKQRRVKYSLLSIAIEKKDYEMIKEYLDDFLYVIDSMAITTSQSLVNEYHIQYETQHRIKQIEKQELIIEKTRTLLVVSIVFILILISLIIMIVTSYKTQKEAYRKIYDFNKRQKDKNSPFASTLKSEPIEIDDSVENQDEDFNDSLNEVWTSILKNMKSQKLYRDQDLNATKMAEVCGTNKTYVYQAAKSFFGESFMYFVNHYRVEEAKLLLDEKNDQGKELSLEEIAEQVGFSSKSSFFRHFKSITGLPPGTYRKLSKVDKMKAT
ncbi:MAG: AraC family transcriptional regulator [Cryomorphaceae bacterium]|nr:AraC family transcriptional regulator [Cryomorphaceae bacterium]